MVPNGLKEEKHNDDRLAKDSDLMGVSSLEVSAIMVEHNYKIGAHCGKFTGLSLRINDHKHLSGR